MVQSTHVRIFHMEYVINMKKNKESLSRNGHYNAIMDDWSGRMYAPLKTMHTRFIQYAKCIYNWTIYMLVLGTSNSDC